MEVSEEAQLQLPAPAKLNLYLHVTGRRPDGYHLLDSVFVPVSLADTVELRVRQDGVIRLLDPPPGLDETVDLSCRAARLLQQQTDCALGADIRLYKRIPTGGGLGGGSSDAATALIGLNHLWKTGQTRAQLSALALSLGADVPFFIFGRPARARGIGEALQPVSLPPYYAVIASPGVGVSTAAVFTAPDLVRNTPDMMATVFPLTAGHNDLQPVAARLQPRITDVLEQLQALGAMPRMSGSGSCVFALTADALVAHDWQRALQRAGVPWSCVAKLLSRHPGSDLLDQKKGL